eukprot:3079916-Ditylum_brightwellii.AAC.1
MSENCISEAEVAYILRTDTERLEREYRVGARRLRFDLDVFRGHHLLIIVPLESKSYKAGQNIKGA